MDRIRRALDTAGTRTASAAARASSSLASSSSDIAALLRSRATASSSNYTSDDRIVLDIGSLYTKVGFAGEHSPRFIVPNRSRHASATKADRTQFWDYAGFFDQVAANKLEYYLADHLTDVFFRYLLTDPKGKTLIVCESVLMPMLLKQTLAKVLFERFRIATLFYAPGELATVLTTGQSAGLVVECGHLDTTVTPVYDYRVLATHARSIPLAGDCVLANLKDLLTKFGSLLTPIDDFRGHTSGSRMPTSGRPMTPPSSSQELVLRGPSMLDRISGLSAVTAFWFKWSNWALGLTSRLGLSPSPETLARAAGVGHGHTLVPWSDTIVAQLLTPEFLEQVKARAVFVGGLPKPGESVTVTEPTEEQLAAQEAAAAAGQGDGGGTGVAGVAGLGDDGLPALPPPVSDPLEPPHLLHQYRIYKSSASTVYYPLGERGVPIGGNRNMKLILPGWVRERAAEPLFDGDADGSNVVTLLLDVLLSCPRDVRGAVARNVIVSGGTALLPGFFSRVREQTLTMLETDDRYRELRGVENVLRFVAPGSGTVQCGPWVGASLAASLKILGAPVQTTMQDFEAWCTAMGEGREEWLVKDWSLGVD